MHHSTPSFQKQLLSDQVTRSNRKGDSTSTAVKFTAHDSLVYSKYICVSTHSGMQ